MALKGIKVVEMLGLAPGPFCGMILAEFGASVTIVDKMEPTMTDVLGSGKRRIALDMKDPRGVNVLRDLCKNSDVLIEPFRPGVMEKLGVGPDVLTSDNPRLIYARLTGYGQSGAFHKRAGHDINYVALSGLLSMLAKNGGNPTPPINFAADLAGGGLLCALGITMALLERTRSGTGQVIDSSMVDGTAYLSSWFYRSQKLPLWGNPPGGNVLDGGAHFYKTYETEDGKHMAVGAIEPQFYNKLLQYLDAPSSELDQYEDFEKQSETLRKIFLTRTRDQWSEIFRDVDACVTPVLTIDEAPEHVHNASRDAFIEAFDGQRVPAPAPRLSNTPAVSLADRPLPEHGEHTREVLSSLNYSEAEIKRLNDEGIVYVPVTSKL